MDLFGNFTVNKTVKSDEQKLIKHLSFTITIIIDNVFFAYVQEAYFSALLSQFTREWRIHVINIKES